MHFVSFFGLVFFMSFDLLEDHKNWPLNGAFMDCMIKIVELCRNAMLAP